MSLLRTLAHLMLALALLAGGLAPGLAQDMPPAEPVAMEMPCHGMDGELVAAEPSVDQRDGCCQGSDCRCDCLQHAPASLVALRPLLPVWHARHEAEPGTASPIPARILPATRPPIA